MSHLPPNKPKREVPTYAQETRVIGQAPEPLVPPELMGKLRPGEPIAASTRAFCEVVAGPGPHIMMSIVKPIVLIGRAEEVVDVFVDDEAASRYHAAITHLRGKFTLTDMGSTNGTLLNGEPVTEVELKSGDRIKIGTTVILFGVL